jgi:kynurenine formamidase
VRSLTRRHYFVKAGMLAAMVGGRKGQAAPIETYSRDVTKEDVDRWMKEFSNWGRWGRDDQAGTANLITPAKRRQAASQVREGVSISLARDADVVGQDVPATENGDRRHTWQHTMTRNVAGRKDGFVIDTYMISFHNTRTTHLDAFAHGFYRGALYNGFSNDTITSWGATKNDVLPFKNGFLTRGVLIDIPALKGVPYLADDEAIYPEDLDAWERKAKVKIETGDAVFVRTGRWRRFLEKGLVGDAQTPGLYASCAKWLRQRDVALLGSDATHDVRPSRVSGVDQPIHQLFLVALGTPLIDCCDLEAVSQAAIRHRRWTFLFTAAPLPVPGGTGSPLNPVATF